MTTAHETSGFDMQAAAKELGIKGGRNGLHKFLRDAGIFKDRLPRYDYIERGLFRVQTKAFRVGTVPRQYTKPFVTGKGLSWLRDKIDAHQSTTANQ